mmetsp:Transcript_16549/g.23240  ORF Transcript_16549/g.23240 Transcript_16549/m.23240 type:complete len:180 (+) Transcript_16549:22-561(+)|eukprot:CAMPEP_0175093430 /NCGR_PEP_ID=MMETSP0086_2-20121207/3011_1 /TAXON_ID=136419 /ORGANISM="Unknown Unknown, Strain D1" /LENGTH=179 /DNA_ID=CAMNT_0016366397 /DNA_START=25 /DNA_END=564 /DNA_ORIENTATION=+
MGGSSSKGSKKKQSKCLVVGLDNSGKSTILNFLKPDAQKQTEMYPTVGFQVEKFRHGIINFTMFDMSGQGRYRNLWEHYYPEAEGIIFVIDSADTVRLCVVKDELDCILSHKDIRNRPIPLLLFANKKDRPKALTPAQISEAIGLGKITDRPWTIVPSLALKGYGLEDGMKWMNSHLLS